MSSMFDCQYVLTNNSLSKRSLISEELIGTNSPQKFKLLGDLSAKTFRVFLLFCIR